MKLAAIDIGSNAIRLQVIRAIKQGEHLSFKKLEYIRFPLRLGREVFTSGSIQEETVQRFEKLMRAFKLLIDLYEVEGYIATATSAMREAKNGQEIITRIATYFDLKITIISGDEEAAVLSKAITPYLDEKNYVHIDVGGGSTELTIYSNREKKGSRSFKIGTVRDLVTKKRKAMFLEIREWAVNELKGLPSPIIAIGTGGNINKLFQLANHKYNDSISLTELQALRAYVSEFDLSQRLSILKMNPDRADVIIPASEIYLEVMKIIGADSIMVPGVGLKDGLLYNLYEELTRESILDIEFLKQF